MKKAEKVNLDVIHYRSYVASALWSVFRCWKTEQWAYKLRDKNGNEFWSQVLQGKPFSYEDEGVSVRCTKWNGFYHVRMHTKVLFQDGIRKEKKISIAA